jgi:23S rRNA pseudouridine1911/1915/1917 synthase
LKKEISILYENPHWLAVNKPAGLIVERTPFESPTVEELVFAHLEEKLKKPYLGIAHRLDRVTSGVLLFAKKKSALRKLNEQFSSRSIRKTYLAVVEPAPSERSQEIIHWLWKDQKNKRAEVYDHPRDKAQEVRLSYRSLQTQGEKALLEIRPHTGKFHQIRAQLAAMGSPICGEDKYGASSSEKAFSIALHAWKLIFEDPASGREIELAAPVPDTSPWNLFPLS